MPLAKGQVNPLNVVGQRRLSYIPPHFGKMSLNLSGINIHNIDQWIYLNLNSRYCIRMKQELNQNKKVVEICEIGIEDAAELTMLNLACPYLHQV